jgi:hypothetical protein
MSTGEAVQVRFRDCECPGTPHAEEGDIVLLRPRLNYQGGAEAFRAVMSAPRKIVTGKDGKPTVAVDEDAVAIHVGPAYLRHGPIGWNVVGDDGPVPLDPDWMVNELPYEQAFPIVVQADNLYGKSLFDPFTKRIAPPSPNGRTASTSTSGAQKSTSKPRTRSARSSPNGTAASEPSI